MRKFAGFIIALVLAVPMLLASLVMISVKSWAFNPDFYVKALTDDRLFQAVELAALNSGEERTIRTEGGYLLDRKATVKAIFAALPREDFKAFAKSTVKEAFDAKLPGQDLSLAGIRESLHSSAPAFAKAYIANLPAMPGKLLDARDFSFKPEGLKAADEKKLVALVAKEIEPEFRALVDKNVPATVKIDASEDDLHAMREMRTFGAAFSRPAQAGINGVIFGALFTGILGAVGGAFVWSRNWSGRFVYAGTTLAIASVFVIVCGVATGALASPDSVVAIAQACGTPALEPGLANALVPVKAYFMSVLQPVARGFFITGIIAASVAYAAVSMRWAFAPRELGEHS